MAVQKVTIDKGGQASNGDFSLKRIYWAAMANGDTGQPVAFPEWADRSVACWVSSLVNGTASILGVSGSVSMEGSMDYIPATEDNGNAVNAGTWTVLTDQNGVAMTYTATALKQMTEAPLWIRPHVTAGDGTTQCYVVLVARRIQPMMKGG